MASTVEQEKQVSVEHQENVSGDSLLADQDDSGVPKGYWRSRRFLGSVAAIILLANNTFIAYSMPVNVLGIINADIGPDANIALVSLVFTTVKGILMLLVGSLSDILGRRYFLIGSQSIGFIGCCVAAKAASVNGLIGASALIAIAGSCHDLYPPLFLEILPNKYRGYGQAALTVAVLPTLGLGPAFARMFVQYTALGWRWMYWLCAITTGTSVVLFVTCYFPPGFEQLTHGMSKKEQWKHIDYVGFALYAGGLVGLLLSLGWGGSTYPWASPQVIALLVIGVVLIAAFILYEIYMPLRTPLVPMKLFKIRDFSIAVIVGSVGQMAYYALNIIWPGQITNLYTTDNLTIGWMSSVIGCALVAGEVFAGLFCKKGAKIRYHYIISVCGLLIFNGLSAMGNENRRGLALACTVLVSFFVGWIECVAIVTASLVLPPENIGVGCAFFASTRAVTGSIAAAIYVAVQSNSLSSALPAKIAGASEAVGIPPSEVPVIIQTIVAGSTAAVAKIPGLSQAAVDTLKSAAMSAYVSAYFKTYLSALSFAGCALIAAFFASNNIDEYWTAFLNKTVDAPHLEALKKTQSETKEV